MDAGKIVSTVIGSGPFQKAIRGLQPVSTGLTAFALVAGQGAGLIYASAASSFTRLVLAADLGIYATSASVLATYTLTAFGRSLSGAVDAAAARALLGITSTATWPKATYATGTTAADLDGVNTYTWASKSGNVYTTNSNPYLTNLTVRNGCTLVKRHIPHVNGTLTVEATGLIHDDGTAATGAVGGGAVAATGRLPEATAQGAGNNGKTVTSGAGSNGQANNPAVGGAGGAGGAAGANLGGTGGVITAPDGATGGILQPGFIFNWLLHATTNWIRVGGGTGGGGGGLTVNTGTGSGGGGGSGAPVSILFARVIVNNGTIRCNGGAGAAAVTTGDAVAGGGGGGGGGYLIIVTDAAPTGSGTITASGGALGAGSGGGASGVGGGVGTVEYRLPA
jgi:hypothetical protein